jgi:hypothetical protein
MEKRGMIAVIEDPFVSKFLRDLLTRRGYRVLESSALQIKGMITEGGMSFALVITNQPNELVSFASDLPLLYLAASPDSGLIARFRNGRALRKPFQTQQLLNAIGELTEAVA